MTSSVYFAKANQTGHIKIGVTEDVRRRMITLSGSCPGGVTLICSVTGDDRLEAHYHQRFAADRVSGEWFSASASLMATISRITAEGDAAVPDEFALTGLPSVTEADRRAILDDIRFLRSLLDSAGSQPVEMLRADEFIALFAEAVQHLRYKDELERANDVFCRMLNPWLEAFKKFYERNPPSKAVGGTSRSSESQG